MGREQQASGAALERDLDAFHVNLSSRGWYVQRNHPKDRRTKGPPDYLATGRFRQLGQKESPFVGVLFDAKACKAERWSVHLLKPHQAQAFDRFEASGGLAGIYLRTALGDAWIAWPDIRSLWRRWYTMGVAAHVGVADGFRCDGGDWTAAVAVDAATRPTRHPGRGVGEPVPR